jgi:RHS repeat-associated protein
MSPYQCRRNQSGQRPRNLAATLPVVISDTDAVYLYGLDIIAEQLAGAERYYYVHDGLGSVRQLLDSSGQIATRYAYDPFGVRLAGNGVSNPWQFTGEAWDGEVELLYLRARYYQPETGRFITKDPWRGDVWRPETLNRYVYVRNNPTNSTDPSGAQEEEDLYSSYESYRQSRELVSDWYHEEGDVRLRFGPKEPLTQDVRHSGAVQQFKNLWRDEANYAVPWAWTGHMLDVRAGHPSVVRFLWGLRRAVRAHWKLGMCHRPWVSVPLESQMDPVDATLGSLDEISVHLEGTHKLLFEVFNTMGRASASRVFGHERSLKQDVHRGQAGSGGNLYMVFYWFEPRDDYPLLSIRPESEMISRLWRYRWE